MSLRNIPLPSPLGTLHPVRAWAILLFAAGLGFLAWHQGVHADKEALKYIGCARDVLRGDFNDLTGTYRGYAAYVMFLLPFVAFDVTIWAVPVQALLSVLAAFALARIAVRITYSPMAGHLSFALFLLSYPTSAWVLALYTEAFFTSITVLFLDRVLRDEGPRWPALVLGLVTVFARPVGILFVGPALIWSISRSGEHHRRGPWWLAHAALVVIVVALPGLERDKLRIIVEGEVISGFPRYPGAIDRLEGSSVMAAQWLLMQERSMGEVLGLFVRRVSSLFTLTRPWYSVGHNVLLAVHYLLYPFAVIGLWSGRHDRRVALLSLILFFNALLIGLTYSEWSGRFLVPLLPIIILLAVIGLWSVSRWSRAGGGRD